MAAIGVFDGVFVGFVKTWEENENCFCDLSTFKDGTNTNGQNHQKYEEMIPKIVRKFVIEL